MGRVRERRWPAASLSEQLGKTPCALSPFARKVYSKECTVWDICALQY